MVLFLITLPYMDRGITNRTMHNRATIGCVVFFVASPAGWAGRYFHASLPPLLFLSSSELYLKPVLYFVPLSIWDLIILGNFKSHLEFFPDRIVMLLRQLAKFLDIVSRPLLMCWCERFRSQTIKDLGDKGKNP